MNKIDKVLSVFDKYDPSQPRAQAGSPHGGEWTAGGYAGSVVTYDSHPMVIMEPRFSPVRGTGYSRDDEGVWRSADRTEAPPELVARIKKLGVPPAWRDVQVNPRTDPVGEPEVVGLDSKGRMQWKYSKAHAETTAAAKFERVREFTLNARPKIVEKAEKDLDSSDPKTRDTAAVVLLIDRTGFRIGSTRDRGGDTEAFGASTLLGKHAKVVDHGVEFTFTGKKGVQQEHTVLDPMVKRVVEARLREVGPEDRLFRSGETDVRSYVKAFGDYKVKDFRTSVATRTALASLADQPRATTLRQAKKIQMQVCKDVSDRLGNTPAMARDSYIDPHVWVTLFPSTGVQKASGRTFEEEVELMNEFLRSIHMGEIGPEDEEDEEDDDELGNEIFIENDEYEDDDEEGETVADRVLTVFDKYESSQARVPAGSPNGGQWVSRGAGSMGLGPSTTTDTTQSLARLHGLHRRGVGAIETEEFGPVTGPELAQHKAAGWDDPTILAAIRKSNAVTVTVGPTDTEGVGDNSHFATGSDGERYIHIAPHQQNGSIFRHEYGHYLDSEMRRQHYLGSEQVLPAVARDLLRTNYRYADSYFNKLPFTDSPAKRRLMDLVSAFTDCELGEGHSKKYYRSNFPSLPTAFEKVTVGTTVVYLGSAHASEAFANYISLRGASSNRLFLDVARKMFPDAISTFDDMLDRYTRVQKLWEMLRSMSIRSS